MKELTFSEAYKICEENDWHVTIKNRRYDLLIQQYKERVDE